MPGATPMKRLRILQMLAIAVLVVAALAIAIQYRMQTPGERLDARTYASEALAREHCENPLPVAGPANGPSRGWRCP